MSELRVDSVKSKGGGAPDLPKGVTISGIATAATLGATTVDVSNVNVSGVVTSGTLSGSLLSTGTPTLGLGVTINSSGVAISGVATAGIVSATTLYGDGSNLTGIGASIAPLFYQPDPYDTGVLLDAGIGITFNQQVKAGTGNVTLSIANAGVAGTVVENFGVGSSVSISENRITINPTADINATQVYHLSYPSGCFTNNEGTDYVGTAYTFEARAYDKQLWVWGTNSNGKLGLSQPTTTKYSSPVQIPGTTWEQVTIGGSRGWQRAGTAIKSDGTMWVWGFNYKGFFGLNGTEVAPQLNNSSPVQVPGTWKSASGSYGTMIASKTDGTLWSWGYNYDGNLGQNEAGGGSGVDRSSPTQIGSGTDWTGTRDTIRVNRRTSFAIKTDGTLWVWGYNSVGQLGLNQAEAQRGSTSSPVQVGSDTTWAKVQGGANTSAAIKTDGTLWMWGRNTDGQLGQNQGGPGTNYSSPIQIPGTTWSQVNSAEVTAAIKTDGTLWMWGDNEYGELGQNQASAQLAKVSSPVQVPGTTWNEVNLGEEHVIASKTDGTLWSWGYNTQGQLGQNEQNVHRSSPTQIPGTTWTGNVGVGEDTNYVIKLV